jgi:hypothetical protein
MTVECRRQERPGLVDDDRSRDHEARDHRRAERDREGIAGMREDELVPVQEGRDRLLEDVEQIPVRHDREPEDQTDAERGQRLDDPPAKLLEVIEERHLTRGVFRHPAGAYLMVLSRSPASSASVLDGNSRTTRCSAARAAAFFP